MKKIVLMLFIAISLFALEKKNISIAMEYKINKATAIIKQTDLTQQEKAQMIFPIFEDVFDYTLITRLSLGRLNWSKMTPEQRDEFQKRFVKHLKNSYMDKIGLYTDEKLEIVELREISEKRIELITKLIGSKDTYDIVYKFHKSKSGSWLIYDIDIIGISLIRTYRSQFNNVLEDESFETLLGKLKKS